MIKSIKEFLPRRKLVYMGFRRGGEEVSREAHNLETPVQFRLPQIVKSNQKPSRCIGTVFG